MLTSASAVSAIGSTPEPMRFRRDLAHLSDEALVALIARSDESALAELYDRIGGTAYGLADNRDATAKANMPCGTNGPRPRRRSS